MDVTDIDISNLWVRFVLLDFPQSRGVAHNTACIISISEVIYLLLQTWCYQKHQGTKTVPYGPAHFSPCVITYLGRVEQTHLSCSEITVGDRLVWYKIRFVSELMPPHWLRLFLSLSSWYVSSSEKEKKKKRWGQNKAETWQEVLAGFNPRSAGSCGTYGFRDRDLNHTDRLVFSWDQQLYSSLSRSDGRTDMSPRFGSHSFLPRRLNACTRGCISVRGCSSCKFTLVSTPGGD